MTAAGLVLAGKRILLLRPAGQQYQLLARLQQHGAEVRHLSVIEICPPEDWLPLDRALRQLSTYDWILFTSTNAVRAVAQRALAIGVTLPVDGQPGPQVCVIGPATSRAAQEAGLPVHRTPLRFIAEGVVEAFGGDPLRDKRLLLPRAAVARDVIPETLRAQGMHVETVTVYRNRLPPNAACEVSRLLAQNWQPDWLLFTSASTVKNLLAAGGRPLSEGARLASIGPATSDTLVKHGFAVDVEAAEHSADGLADALLRACAADNSNKI